MQPLLTWKNKYSTACVCIVSLSYPPCNAHAPYCYLWPALLYDISQRYLNKGTSYGKKKSYWTQIVRFDILYNFRLKKFP